MLRLVPSGSREKVEKLKGLRTERQTNRKTPEKTKSEKLTRAFISGEPKINVSALFELLTCMSVDLS